MLDSHNIRFTLPIWRVLYDVLPTSATQNIVVLELRDKTNVEWCALHVETGEISWQHAFIETDWWTGLIGFYAGKLLLHAYTGSEQPAPKQLLVVDALSGNMSWTLAGCKFEGTDGLTIQTSRANPEQPLILEHWSIANGNPAGASFLQPIQESTFWKFPISHEESSPYYSVIRQFIQKITNKIPQKAINYGEIAGHLLFFNYLYPANAITLSRSILVVNSTKTVLLNEPIDSDKDSAVFDECFYSEHHIIYLKKLDELVVIKLPRP
ncbi:DUF4905 domain-containing protein [Runella sp.]|uniref:DUF4905 domain-containing protein n=1 Tax=Runella sp. TaxID=1960881 RepID=UPI002621B6AB|nr:DUF4905 domain-containing protein [Runella sp.]